MKVDVGSGVDGGSRGGLLIMKVTESDISGASG